ncbi:MAG: leucyl aminopeptidase [Gemmatimonadales bacterium]
MSLDTAILSADPATHETPLLIVIVPQGKQPASLGGLDAATGGAIERLYGAEAFAGKRDQTTVLYPSGPASRVLLVGSGKPEDLDRAALRRAAAVAGRAAAGMGVGEAALVCATEVFDTLSEADVGQTLAEGVTFGAWRFEELKEPPREKKTKLERVDLLVWGDRKGMEAGYATGAAIAAGQCFARRLQMLPGNTCTPTYLGEVAIEMAGRHGFKVTVMDRAAIDKEGMGGLLAVSRGGSEEPRFIMLEYEGAEGPPVVLVGKGVTFDTGGISLKPALNMEDMKFDMSGAAAVLGAFEAIGRMNPQAHVIGLIPSTENMLSGTAVKPGDVIKGLSGKTIEIINTDAEGRLILADALSFASRLKPAAVIDIATLTGAVVIALGHVATGLMGNDEDLLEEIETAGTRSGERVWPMPMWEEYRDLLKSEIADVKNSGGRPAGAISAGWFLKEFADGYPWGHLDIAGTAYADRSSPIMGKGPTGAGVRLFSEFVLARQG